MAKLLNYYKCDYCDKDDLKGKAAATAHEKACATRIAKEKYKQEKEQLLMDGIKSRVAECVTVEDVIKVCNDVYREKTGKPLNLKVIGRGFRSVGNVSNSHGAPYGKKTNWSGRNKDEPRSYPGFSGSISYNNAAFGDGFRILQYIGVNFHTSSGGPSNHGAYFFIDDFPGVKAEFERQEAELEKYKLAMNEYEDKVNAALEDNARYVDIRSDIVDINDEIRALYIKQSELHDDRNIIENETRATIGEPKQPHTPYVKTEY